MESLTSVFRQLLSMSLTALPVMAVVLAVRFLLGRVPKRFRYLLWAVVAFRLVCPVSFTSPVGLVEPGEMERRVETAGESYVGESRVTWNTEEQMEAFQKAVEHGNPPVYGGEDGYYVVTKPDGVSPADTLAGTVLPMAAVVWLLGMAAMLAYGGGTYFRLRRRVAMAVRREGNVWECDNIPTPFVLGFFRPRVYIPFRLSEEERRYVLAHERYHIRHLDHWVKLLGYLILAVYWWNPSVWLCWVLCCRDMEMRCDEAVLARLGDGVKAGYSMSLVSFALDRRTPMALAFGEHDAARRVKNVLHWKRARPAAVFLAVAAVVLAAAVCGTDAERGSWLEAEWGGNGVAFACEMKEPIRSWAIYEDIYENGELISSRPCIMDSFQDDGGASPRELWTTLSVSPVYAEDGFSGELTVNFGLDGAGTVSATRSITLPKDHYTGMGSVFGDGGEETPARWKLEDDGSVALYTVKFSTLPDGGIRAGGRVFDDDTVVRYRFVTSTLSMGELTADRSLARTLFDLRVDSAADTEAVEAILTALGMDVPYTLEPFEGREDILLIRCAEEPEINMSSVDALLRALVGDIRQAGYAYPKPDGSTVYVNTYVNADRDWLEETAQRLGYRNIKALGETAAGIQALLDYLDWEEQPGSSSGPLDELVRELFALRVDGTEGHSNVEKMLEVLHTDALGTYTVEWVDSETVRVRFGSLFVSRDELQSGMQGRAALIMAVGGDVAQVRWSGEEPESWLAQYYRAGADYIAENLGYQDAVRLGETAAGIRALLDFLGWAEPSSASSDPLDQTGTGSVQERQDYRITLDPERWQLQAAQSDDAWQFAKDANVGIEVVTMAPELTPGRLAQNYASWNRDCAAVTDLSLPEESPFAYALAADMADGSHQEVYMTDRGDENWHLVILMWDDVHGDLLPEMRRIAASLVELDTVHVTALPQDAYRIFQSVLDTLPEGSGCAFLPLDSGPLLLVTDETYSLEEDGETVDASFYCRRVYRAAEDGIQELDGIHGGGTAYPIRWDAGSLYAAAAHGIGRYALTGDGTGFEIVESAVEAFDENGGVSYSYTSPETGTIDPPDDRYLQAMLDAYGSAQLARFVPVT